MVTMVKPRGEEEILIDTVDFTDESSCGENYRKVIHDSRIKAEENYNVITMLLQ